MTDTTAILIYRDPVTLTLPQDVTWVLALLLLMGIMSCVHAALDWRDQLVASLKGFWRRRAARD